MVHPSDDGHTARAAVPLARAVVIGLLAVPLVACVGPRVPDFVGIVVDEEFLPGSVRRLSTEGGNFIELDLDDGYRLRGGSGGATPGTLLLAGEHVGGQWYLSLSDDRGDGCYVLYSYGSDADDSVVFDNGLQLPKTHAFDPGTVTDGRYDAHPQGFFCVNSDGQVVSYRG